MNLFERRRTLLASFPHQFYIFKEGKGIQVEYYNYNSRDITISNQSIQIPAKSTSYGVLLLSPTLTFNDKDNQYETSNNGFDFSQFKTLNIEYELTSNSGFMTRNCQIKKSRTNRIESGSNIVGNAQYDQLANLDTITVGTRQLLTLNCANYGQDKILAIFSSVAYVYNIYNIWLE